MSNPDRTELANALRDRIRELEAELETLAAELRGLLLGEDRKPDVEQ
jgi:hypothetical protein